MMKQNNNRTPWLWVPTLYFTEGLPYVLVVNVSVIYYKVTGLSNADIAFYTSLLYLPWLFKPLWSPVVDLVSTKRQWTLRMQAFLATTFLLIALTVAFQFPFAFSLTLFFIIAFLSATHDIAADGFYMLALSQAQQSAFVGVRSMFYRIAMISGQGGLVVLAGILEPHIGIHQAWSSIFLVSGIILCSFFFYHTLSLPLTTSDTHQTPESFFKDFFIPFKEFFSNKHLLLIIVFLLLYRFAEAMLVKIVPLFLLDTPEKGGLGLTTQDVGIIYGTIGVIALVGGGILGGYVISKKGLRQWLWPMTFAIHLPDIIYIYLSYALPKDLLIPAIAIGFEQFGYGFGFTAYTMYMIFVSEGKHRTSHYALCTGFMALSMIVPGMVSGILQELVGYQVFFLFVVLATLPAFIATGFVFRTLPSDFGKKQ